MHKVLWGTYNIRIFLWNFNVKYEQDYVASRERVAGGGGGGVWSTRALPQDGVNKRVENSYELDVDLNILAYIKQNCFKKIDL